MHFQVTKGSLSVILAAFLSRSFSCSPTWSEQAPSSTGSFCWRLIFSIRSLAQAVQTGQTCPRRTKAVRNGICVAQKARRRLPGAQHWHPTTTPASRPAAQLCFLNCRKSRGEKHACMALPVTAGGRLAYLWSQRFLLRLTDSQDPFAAWSLELISMRKGPPRTERCSRSSLQSCHTHTGFFSALAWRIKKQASQQERDREREGGRERERSLQTALAFFS